MPRSVGSQASSALGVTSAGSVTLRQTGPADEAFLRTLHADVHPELVDLDLPPASIAQLLDLQITAQKTQYGADYPAAQDHVVREGGNPVGRCWTHQSDSELRLLDLAVLSRHRRRGIGRAVMSALCDRAEKAGVPLRLQVWHTNMPAQRLYAGMGFRGCGQVAGYLAMERPAADSTPHRREAGGGLEPHRR